MIGPITLLEATSAAGNLTSGWLDLGDFTGCSITCLISGSNIAGTLTLDCSNDMTTLVEVPSSSTAITSSADHIYNVSDVQYRYIRVAWAASSGTGNLSVTGVIKQPYIPKQP